MLSLAVVACMSAYVPTLFHCQRQCTSHLVIELACCMAYRKRVRHICYLPRICACTGVKSITSHVVVLTLALFVLSGVDIASLLRRFGLEASGTNEKVGTVAIAYAAHKALSPVRFPPTVALTPVVAKAIGKKPKEDDKPQDL